MSVINLGDTHGYNRFKIRTSGARSNIRPLVDDFDINYGICTGLVHSRPARHNQIGNDSAVRNFRVFNSNIQGD